jgi:uncharacterized protein
VNSSPFFPRPPRFLGSRGWNHAPTSHFAGNVARTPDDITNVFWCACHVGQRESAESRLRQGDNLNWIGHNELTPMDAARRSGADELVEWLRTQGAKSTEEQR